MFQLNSRGYVDTGFVKYLTVKEFKIINKEVERLESPSMKLCLRVLMYLGLRISEAVKLKRDNFNKDFSILNYEQCRKSKLRIKQRMIPTLLKRQLQGYYKKWFWKMKERFLFFPYKNQSKNSHITRGAIIHKVMILRRKTGIDDYYYIRRDGKKLYRFSAHTFRHFAIWRYYEAGGKCLKIAQEMIGHTKPETTAKYINVLESTNKERLVIEKAFDI